MNRSRVEIELWDDGGLELIVYSNAVERWAMISWCTSNLKGWNWYSSTSSDYDSISTIFTFASLEDAMAFKLMWEG